jgi:hypothetical protein
MPKKKKANPGLKGRNSKTGTAAELIYVVCDKCHEPIPSGIAADPSTMNGRKFGNNRTHCTSCGHMILWSKAELWPKSLALAKRRSKS